LLPRPPGLSQRAYDLLATLARIRYEEAERSFALNPETAPDPMEAVKHINALLLRIKERPLPEPAPRHTRRSRSFRADFLAEAEALERLLENWGRYGEEARFSAIRDVPPDALREALRRLAEKHGGDVKRRGVAWFVPREGYETYLRGYQEGVKAGNLQPGDPYCPPSWDGPWRLNLPPWECGCEYGKDIKRYIEKGYPFVPAFCLRLCEKKEQGECAYHNQTRGGHGYAIYGPPWPGLKDIAAKYIVIDLPLRKAPNVVRVESRHLPADLLDALSQFPQNTLIEPAKLREAYAAVKAEKEAREPLEETAGGISLKTPREPPPTYNLDRLWGAEWLMWRMADPVQDVNGDEVLPARFVLSASLPYFYHDLSEGKRFIVTTRGHWLGVSRHGPFPWRDLLAEGEGILAEKAKDRRPPSKKAPLKAEVQRRYLQGETINILALQRELGLSRNTIKKWLHEVGWR